MRHRVLSTAEHVVGRRVWEGGGIAESGRVSRTVDDRGERCGRPERCGGETSVDLGEIKSIGLSRGKGGIIGAGETDAVGAVIHCVTGIVL